MKHAAKINFAQLKCCYILASLLARQSMLMLTELPGIVTVFEQFFLLEYSDSYTSNIHHYCICHSQGTAFEILLALNYNSIILTVVIIGVGIYSIQAGDIMYLIPMLEIITVIVRGHVYCWKYHPCIN